MTNETQARIEELEKLKEYISGYTNHALIERIDRRIAELREGE